MGSKPVKNAIFFYTSRVPEGPVEDSDPFGQSIPPTPRKWTHFNKYPLLGHKKVTYSRWYSYFNN